MRWSRLVPIVFVALFLLVASACGGGEAAPTPTATPTATPTLTPTATVGLHIENVQVCSDVRGDRDYTVRGGAIFQLGERVYVYFETFGLTWQSTDGKYEVWFTISSLELYDPSGELVSSLTDLADVHLTQLEVVPNYGHAAVYCDILPGSPTGQYRAEITAKDDLSGETASTTAYFTME